MLEIRTSSEYWDLLKRLRGYGTPGAVTVVGVDGRSGSGKTTFADALAALADDVAIVRTDDIAWHHSFFDWSQLLVENVLMPLHLHGPPLSYRPQAWISRARDGAITVPDGATLVLVEGVGACNRTIEPLLNACVWIETAPQVGRDRVRARGVDSDEFIADWTAQEELFFTEQQPWQHADFIVSGETLAPPP